MKINALRLTCVWGVLFTTLMIGQQTGSRLVAKITMPDGATETARLEGVGCSAAICSRVAIQGKSKDDALVKTRLVSIATIKETSDASALLVLKDGTSRRLSVVKDFRVLYLANPSGSTRKLDLADIKAVEFLPASK